MARSRTLFGFAPPFRFIAERLLLDAEFRSDLNRIVNLPEEEFRNLADAFDAHPNFLTPSGVALLAKKTVTAEADPFANSLNRLYLSMRSAQEPEEEALEGLCAAVAKQSTEFPPEKIGVLKLRVQRLLLTPLGLKRQQKAETLAEATGADLNEVNIICDIRPVFDNDRKKIEGAVVISTLTLEISELDGKLTSVECRLTESQVDDLCKVAINAKQKLAAVKDMLATKSIPMATVFDIFTAEEK